VLICLPLAVQLLRITEHSRIFIHLQHLSFIRQDDLQNLVTVKLLCSRNLELFNQLLLSALLTQSEIIKKMSAGRDRRSYVWELEGYLSLKLAARDEPSWVVMVTTKQAPGCLGVCQLLMN